MKKIVFTAIITAFFTGLLSFIAMAFFLRPTTLEIGAVDLSTVVDGEYIGICQNKILFAVVKVKISDNQIMRIDILEHKESYMEQARVFSDNIISEQSLEVDVVSGATLTSNTIRKAVENALSQDQ